MSDAAVHTKKERRAGAEGAGGGGGSRCSRAGDDALGNYFDISGMRAAGVAGTAAPQHIEQTAIARVVEEFVGCIH